MVFTGCITTHESVQAHLGHYYLYKFGIKENKGNWKKPEFQDDMISIDFSPNYNTIGMQIVNQSAEIITIDWNNVTFEENDIKSHVLVWGSDFGKKTERMPISVLKPGQGIRTGIVPIDMIDYAPKDSTADKNGYVVHQMYPDFDRLDDKESYIIMGLLGAELFKIKMPIVTNRQKIDYNFTFSPVEIERTTTPPISRH